MKKIVIMIVSFTILIGITALALNTALGNQTITFIQKIKYQTGNTHFYYWKFDFAGYISNISMNTADISILVFDIPTRTWIDQLTGWGDFTNNLAVILDYIIMILNAILYPLKIGAYLLRNVLALLGVNQDTTNQYNGLAWLVTFVKDILGRIAIPYV